jgi:hypothetical protein
MRMTALNMYFFESGLGHETVDINHVSRWAGWLAQHSNNDVVDMATTALVIRKPGLGFYITLKYTRSSAGQLYMARHIGLDSVVDEHLYYSKVLG